MTHSRTTRRTVHTDARQPAPPQPPLQRRERPRRRLILVPLRLLLRHGHNPRLRVVGHAPPAPRSKPPRLQPRRLKRPTSFATVVALPTPASRAARAKGCPRCHGLDRPRPAHCIHPFAASPAHALQRLILGLLERAQRFFLCSHHCCLSSLSSPAVSQVDSFNSTPLIFVGSWALLMRPLARLRPRATRAGNVRTRNAIKPLCASARSMTRLLLPTQPASLRTPRPSGPGTGGAGLQGRLSH